MNTTKPDLYDGDLLDHIPYADGGRLGAPAPVTTCRWCGRNERNEFLCRNNHAPDCYRAQATTWCTAMDLTLSHCVYWQHALKGTVIPAKGHRPAEVELAAAIARAEQVWGPRVAELHAVLADQGIDMGAADVGPSPVAWAR